MKKFTFAFLSVLFMMVIEIPLVYSQGAPMPFRIGGTVTIDGVQITQATDDGILIRVTKSDGTNYEDANGNAPEDKDGLNARNWYMIDIPIYKATVQPKGATPGETAAIHVYKNSQELRVTNPPNGQITIGGEGTSSRIDLTIVSIASPYYDDFEKTNIDPNKWDSWEYVREIEDGKLVSKINAYGKQVNNALSFKNPNSINYIEADVVINEAKADYEPNDSSIYSYAYACLSGYFYNDGTASDPGSLKGEVQATIEIIQYRGQLFADWRVSKAMDDGGTNRSAIGGARFSNSIDLNTTYKLSILFERSLKRFTFGVGTTTLTWTSPDTIHPSNHPWKGIGTLVGFSSSTGSFSGKISAAFDNVIAKDESGNVVMSDDFSFPIIDSDKWSDYEFVRDVFDGQLWLEAGSLNQSIKNELFLKNPDQVRDFQAKVSLFNFENPDGASTRARLGGYFYNDTGNPGSGYMGDVWAEVTLGGKGETPSAGWSVVRFDDQEGNASTILDTGTFPISIDTDQTYNLFLGWDGSKFSFKCDESVVSYTPTTAKYPPNNKIKELAIRISAPSPAPPSYSAYISAGFDDVLVTEASVPPPNQYTLKVTKSGTGSGTVTSSPAGINCGSDCSETYNQGTSVTLTATTASGSTFGGWSGACSGTGGCSVTMNSDKTVTATFTLGQKPNLTPYQPQGWSDKIVVSNVAGTTTDSSPLYTTDTLYVDWAVINQGPGAVTARFSTTLYVDGVGKLSWYLDALNPNNYEHVNDYSIGSLSAGTHTIKIVADSENAIDESNESDNEYTKTITVTNPNGPDLTGEWISVTQSCKTTSKGKTCKITGSLKVENIGNRGAPSFYVEIYLSSSDSNQPDTLVKRLSVGKLKAGATKTLKITYSLPTGQSASGRDIYASIDVDKTVEERDEANNLVIYTIP